MSFAVGIFDLFAYTIPGALYLGLVGYVVVRVGWVDPAVVGRAPAVVLIVVIVLVSYLLGYLGYPVGAGVSRLVPRRRERLPRQEFVARVPVARERGYVAADPHVLLSAVQLHDKDVAVEVVRLRAAGLMLRNSAPPVAAGAIVGVVEVIAGRHPAPAAAAAVALGVAFVSMITGARRLGHWATMKTLELGFWVPGIDDKFVTSPGQDTGA